MSPPVCQVEIRSVYGEVKAYPANYAAEVFAAITGTKTLTASVLSNIKKLGYEVKQTHKEIVCVN
jgi:hypothetical protein